MKYTYQIILDKQADMWNWRDAAKNNMRYGYNWLNNLGSDHDRKIFNRISKLNKKNAEGILLPYLNKKYEIDKDNINEYIKYLNKVFSIKFNEACELLGKISNRKPFFNNYIIRVTTFPRSPYDSGKGILYMKLYDKGPIALFMHEALHFQIHNYWEKDAKSPVSQLSDEDFHYLKESLTVVLDIDLAPLTEIYDRGYPIHQNFRKFLHKHWQRYHDFDKLVDYGLKNLHKFKKQ